MTVTSADVKQVYGAMLRSTLDDTQAAAWRDLINANTGTNLYGIDDLNSFEGKVFHTWGVNAGADQTDMLGLCGFADLTGTELNQAGLNYMHDYAIYLQGLGFSDQNISVNIYASLTTPHLSRLSSTIDTTYGINRHDAVQAIYANVFGGTASQTVQDIASAALDFYVGYSGSEDGARGCLWGAWENSVIRAGGGNYTYEKGRLDDGAHGTYPYDTW